MPFCTSDRSVGGGSGLDSLEELRWRRFSFCVRLTTFVREEAAALPVAPDADCDIVVCRDCFTFALELA